jgi:hypothetical protein
MWATFDFINLTISMSLSIPGPHIGSLFESASTRGRGSHYF